MVIWGTDAVAVFGGLAPDIALAVASYGQGKVAIFNKKAYLKELRSDWQSNENKVL